MSLTVERATPESWRRLRAVRLAGLADAPEMFGSNLARELAFDEGEWRRRAARPATFVAARDGVDVGTAGVFETDGDWWLMGMWVAVPTRGTGVAAALAEACEALVVGAGATSIRLWVMADNQRGRRTYARLGYADTGVREEAPDGRVELLLSKALPATPR